jgi:uncharacterized protein YjiS (DUF1127 family)
MSHAICRVAPSPACAPAGARPAARDPGLPARRGVAWFTVAFDRLARPWRRRAAILELDRLSERELRDIGIERGEVEGVVDELMTSARKSRLRAE